MALFCCTNNDKTLTFANSENKTVLMDIEILQLIEGSKHARGLAVIIDVFRAFSVTCYAYYKGINHIYPVGSISEAYEIKKKYPDYLLVGEREEKKPDGFDFGNSPTQLMTADIHGKTMIHTTSSGTQGIVNALEADEIITGSFVNAGAIIRYIKQQNPTVLSLVCMGYASRYETDEDTFCAKYIKAELEGKFVNFEKMKRLLQEGSGARFFAPEKQEWAPESDFDLCLDLNRFNFILKVEQDKGYNHLKKIDI